MKGKWKDMKGHECTKGIWKDYEGKWREITNESKGTWKEIERKMKGNEYKMKGRWMQMKGKWRKMHANECKMKGTWSVAEAPETNKTTPRSSIHFRACLGMDFGFMLDLEHADFHKTLESDRPPPKSDNHNNSNYSDVKDVDGSSRAQKIFGMSSGGPMASHRCVPVVCHSATRLLRTGLNEQLQQRSRAQAPWQTKAKAIQGTAACWHVCWTSFVKHLLSYK